MHEAYRFHRANYGHVRAALNYNGLSAGRNITFERFSRLFSHFEAEGVAQSGGGEPAYDGEAWFGTNFVGPGPDANPYTLPDPKNPRSFLRPIDAIDKAAQKHDFYYWKAGASGVKGALFDKQVAAADAILASDALEIIVNYQYGGLDEVTGLPISNRTYAVALGVFYSFTPLSLNKFINY